MPQPHASVLPLEKTDPRVIGPFRILGVLGEGGMGVVYLGDDAFGRHAAVKVMRTDAASHPEYRERFAREVRAGSAVSGPGVARVLGSDLAGQPPWLAIEYVPGPTLARMIREGGPLKTAQARAFATALAAAVETISLGGVVHRDIKPSNVIMSENGPKLIDFGVCLISDATALTMTGASRSPGTSEWMAPEQISGWAVDSSTDVFAWGLVVAYAALGRHPFGGASGLPRSPSSTSESPDLRDMPGDLFDAVAASLQPDPAMRPDPSTLLRMLSDDDASASAAAAKKPGHRGSRRGKGSTAAPEPPPIQAPSQPATATPQRRRVWFRRTVVGGMAFGLVAALAAGGWAIASQPVTTVAQQEPTHEPSTGSGTATATNLAPSWNEEVTGTNADRFDQWLRDHEGQVVRIDATLDGYWEDAGTTFSLQDPESLALTSTVTFVPSSSGRPGFEGGAGSYAGLSGYYAVNPSYFASTGGWRHSLQALDTVEALNLLRNEPARSVPTATATATPATPTNPSTPTPQAQTAAPGLVSPPTVDSLRIGMTIQQAEQTGGAHWDPNYWGEGSGALAATSDWYSLSDNGITLTGIAINGSYWATPEGISVGSSVSDLYSAYPGLHPSEADPAVHLIWNGDWGYQFFVTDGTVSNIAFGTGYGQSAVYD